MINIEKIFRKTTKFRARKDENGDMPFKEFEDFIIHDIEVAIRSMEVIAERKGKHSITTDEVIEYFGMVGRPQLDNY